MCASMSSAAVHLLCRIDHSSIGRSRTTQARYAGRTFHAPYSSDGWMPHHTPPAHDQSQLGTWEEQEPRRRRRSLSFAIHLTSSLLSSHGSLVCSGEEAQKSLLLLDIDRPITEEIGLVVSPRSTRAVAEGVKDCERSSVAMS